MFEATCTCGYNSGVLFDGCGMAGEKSNRALARCDHCRQIVSIPDTGGRHRCPTCRRKVVVLPVPSNILGERPRADPFGPLECPQCQRVAMRLVHAGLWD